jgi:hypothetical protein
MFHSFANLIVVTENYFIYKYVNLEYCSITYFYSFYAIIDTYTIKTITISKVDNSNT